jgi:hypothetical protein
VKLIVIFKKIDSNEYSKENTEGGTEFTSVNEYRSEVFDAAGRS